MLKSVIVFDLDGVIIDSGKLFDAALAKFSDTLYSMLGGNVSKEEILMVQHRIDMGMLYEKDPETDKPYYYRKSRFPLSFMRTYRFFCYESGKKYIKNIALQLKEIGREAYNKERYKELVFPEAAPTLQFLTKNGFLVLILTKGDKRVQGAKDQALKELGIAKFYREFIIVSDDKSGAIRRIKEKYPADRYYCVGDTYKEDVLVGINVGYFGFYKPYALNWKERGKLDQIESERDKKNSIKISNLAEICRYLGLK